MSVLLKKAAKIESGSKQPQKDKVGSVAMKQVEDIAKLKMPDLNCTDVSSAIQQVLGTAKSIGLEIKG